jgi:hypothetical protein
MMPAAMQLGYPPRAHRPPATVANEERISCRTVPCQSTTATNAKSTIYKECPFPGFVTGQLDAAAAMRVFSWTVHYSEQSIATDMWPSDLRCGGVHTRIAGQPLTSFRESTHQHVLLQTLTAEFYREARWCEVAQRHQTPRNAGLQAAGSKFHHFVEKSTKHRTSIGGDERSPIRQGCRGFVRSPTRASLPGRGLP